MGTDQYRGGLFLNRVERFCLLFLTACTLQALQIDVSTLQKIIQEQPDALQERLILARYYLQQSNVIKAEDLVQDVLRKDPKNPQALKIEARIQKYREIKKRVKEANLSYPIDLQKAQKRLDEYHEKRKFHRYITLYQTLIEAGLTPDEKYHLQAAEIHLEHKKYDLARKALDRLRDKKSFKALQLDANLCYLQKRFSCAAKLFQTLYRIKKEPMIAQKLIESYLQLGEIEKAKGVYTQLKKHLHNNTDIEKIGRDISKKERLHIRAMQKRYRESPNIKTLLPYVTALIQSDERAKALQVLHTYNLKHPSHDSLMLEAKYLNWYGKKSQAVDVLKNSLLKNDPQALFLLGQIEAWRQHYRPARKYLKDALQKSDDPQLRYKVKKMLAFIEMWQGHEKEAKAAFTALHDKRPDDREVNEALMRLNHNYKRLIAIYKHKKGTEAIKELGDLYMLDHRPGEAIRYWRIYLKSRPEDLEILKKIALAQISMKDDYHGFGNLEEYALKKGSGEAYLLLAKNYYWRGYEQAALDVLHDLLLRDPQNKEALKLKGKILKTHPRYINDREESTTKIYWENLARKELYIADTLYLDGHEESALEYYRNYLRLHPDDYEVHYRYAFALEKAGHPAEAAGEFALVQKVKKRNQALYHYAYNLMKTGRLDRAEKILRRLRKEVYRKLSPELETFINGWKRAWESRNFNTYRTFYDPKITQNRAWSDYKRTLFSHLKHISVTIKNPLFKPIAPNRYQIRFFQIYQSDKHRDKGYKTLIIQCQKGMRACRIVKERWQRGSYKKRTPLYPSIEHALQELKRLRLQPQKARLSSSHKGMSQPIPLKYRDIYLAPGIRKDLLKKEEVFEIAKAKPEPVKKVGQVYAQNMGANPTIWRIKNRGGVRGYHYRDNDDFCLDSADLFYTRLRLGEEMDVGLDAGVIRVAQHAASHRGFRIGSTLRYGDLSFRLGMNRFKDFIESVPGVKYRFFYKQHHFTLQYTRQNALFYTYNLTPYDKRIRADHFALNDYAAFENGMSLWASLGFNRFDNGDVETVPQFDWIFYNPHITKQNFHWDLALEGWYTAHTKPHHGDFYSPSFADSTLVRLDADYIFSPLFKISAQVGAGHSFHDENNPYKYGIWLQGRRNDTLYYKLGCLQSNTARIGSLPGGYHYIECNADIGYLW